MADAAAYQASTLDSASVRRVARQVAATTTAPRRPPITYTDADSGQTVVAIGEHWLLDTRQHTIESLAELAEETSYEHYFFVLCRTVI